MNYEASKGRPRPPSLILFSLDDEVDAGSMFWLVRCYIREDEDSPSIGCSALYSARQVTSI
jgi:hypothetical protein